MLREMPIANEGICQPKHEAKAFDRCASVLDDNVAGFGNMSSGVKRLYAEGRCRLAMQVISSWRSARVSQL